MSLLAERFDSVLLWCALRRGRGSVLFVCRVPLMPSEAQQSGRQMRPCTGCVLQGQSWRGSQHCRNRHMARIVHCAFTRAVHYITACNGGHAMVAGTMVAM